ncbi:hypothetical protein TrispH2_008134, partial [Trichoplax sp. H2]
MIYSRNLNCLKVRLTSQHDNESILAWLSCYKKKERKFWEKEKQFYCNMKLYSWKLHNIAEHKWFREGEKCNIDTKKLKIQLDKELLVCYALSGEDICTLKDFISCQSEYLTPESITHIVQDIEIAVNSLQSHLIIHGSISTDSVYIVISSKGKRIKALLGKFLTVEVFHDAIRYPSQVNLLMNDRNSIKLLCEELAVLCKLKADNNVTSNENFQNNASPPVDNRCQWKATQEW